ncbi:MAG: biotin carboxylase [Candidatus Paceibacteria bacterium]|jgi:biotin carboxylase
MSKITQKKYILYVGSVKSWREDLESHIQKKGLLWQIVSLTQKSPEIEIKEETEYFKNIQINFDNPEEIKEVLETLGKQLIAVVNRGERNIPLFQKLIPHLREDLLVPTVDALTKATEKIAMRKAFWKYDKTITPKFEIITEISDEEITRINKRLEFPVIVKPSGLAQAVLVQAAHYPAELKEILLRMEKYMKKSYKDMKGRGMPSILIEEIIDGNQYSVEAFVDDIGNVSFCPFIKYITSAQKGFDDFFSYEQTTPATISKESAQAAKAVSIKGLNALGLRNSIAHIELIRKEGAWKIVEIGARMGGFRSMMYRKSFGINLDIQDIKIHLGRPVTLPRKKKGYTSVIKFFARDEGIITKIVGIKKAKTLPSFFETVQNLKKGDKARFAKNGGTHVFRVTLFNENKAQFIEDKRRLEKMVNIETKKKIIKK